MNFFLNNWTKTIKHEDKKTFSSRIQQLKNLLKSTVLILRLKLFKRKSVSAGKLFHGAATQSVSKENNAF